LWGERLVIRPAVIATSAVTVALLAGCGGSGGPDSSTNSTGSTSPSGAEIVSPDSLRATASKAATAIYWAGEQGDTELELSRPDKDRTYVRYLTGSAEAGDKRADFLTIGTYAQPNAAASLDRQAKRSGGTIDHAPGNATVYYDRANSGSVYLAYPDAPVEVEVFDPSFKRALRLVETGQIVAVE
jgi:hypothetical protein